MWQAQAHGDRFGLSVTVLGELYFAAFTSRRQAENLRRLQALVASLGLWPYDEAAAETFGRIRAEQRSRGRPIPPLDVQIAAIAHLHRLILLTADRHFHFIEGLTVENWLSA